MEVGNFGESSESSESSEFGGAVRLLGDACGEVLSLPVFPELTREQQDHVIGEVGKWVG
ncbi:MAG: hypothetical protein O3A87_01945 [Verrucomicrobia bacterium]|nr:hypothetical protein [Verrucomicrobiota bacterium]MDA1005234.1 hypothetical protein [Verrucomicrobiota bacterium]